MENSFIGTDAGNGNEPTQIVLRKVCSITGVPFQLSLDAKKYEKLKEGKLVQEVFPELSAEDREFIISGLTPAEWGNYMRILE
jgi:hypothetical protein